MAMMLYDSEGPFKQDGSTVHVLLRRTYEDFEGGSCFFSGGGGPDFLEPTGRGEGDLSNIAHVPSQ